MLTPILIILVGMGGVFLAEINGHIYQGKNNLPIRQIRFVMFKKQLPSWIVGVYVVSNIVSWIGCLTLLAHFFSP